MSTRPSHLAPRTCSQCGCTETTPCSTPAGPCHWSGPEICSACLPELNPNPSQAELLELYQPIIGKKIVLHLDGHHAFSLMAGLQLLLRHPQFAGPTHDICHDIALALHMELAITPELAALCEAGWNPAHDVPADEPRIIIP
jgi:hypothetical protein